jgi:hypothetical protein
VTYRFVAMGLCSNLDNLREAGRCFARRELVLFFQASAETQKYIAHNQCRCSLLVLCLQPARLPLQVAHEVAAHELTRISIDIYLSTLSFLLLTHCLRRIAGLLLSDR